MELTLRRTRTVSLGNTLTRYYSLSLRHLAQIVYRDSAEQRMQEHFVTARDCKWVSMGISIGEELLRL